MKTEHLVGLPYVAGGTDCYGLIRSFYKDNFDIDLPNYARPDEFWSVDMNLYMERFHKHGFRVLDAHPSEFRPGDGIVMAIRSQVGNHAGVLLEDGQMLHHMYGRLSTIESYSGLWRNTTIAVLRHKDVPEIMQKETGSYLDFVSPQKRRQVEEAIRTLQQ